LKPSNIILSIWIILAGAGCTKTESNNTPVARLDNQTLALEEIRAHIDTSREPSQVQIQQYIQRWLTEETLYREAVERGLDRSDEMNQKVEDVRRQLAINALLEQEVYSQQVSNFSEQDVRQYYEAHIKEFNQKYDIALVSYALFKNRDAATEFRNSILKGTSWNSAVGQHTPSILLRMDSSYQTQASLISSELWRVVTNATQRELSFPVSTDKGYYILVVWKFVKQGQTADLVLVEQEIRGRLAIDRRRKLSERLVQKLRAKHAIEVFGNAASDSGMSKIAE
jgi:hypothetical protein